MAAESKVAQSRAEKFPAEATPPPYPASDPEAAAPLPPAAKTGAGSGPACPGGKCDDTGRGSTGGRITRGPLLVLIVAYGVLSLWEFLGYFAYLDDPNALVLAHGITALIFHGASVLMSGLGSLAFCKTQVGLMGVYVWSLIGLQLLAVTSFVLSTVAPLPQRVQDLLSYRIAEGDGRDLGPEVKTHRTLMSAAGLLFRTLYICLVLRYYLSIKKHEAGRRALESASSSPAV